MDQDTVLDSALIVAKLMCAAAITAPKGKGANLISTKIIYGEELQKIADLMKADGAKYNKPSFTRDGKNLRNSLVLVLIGSKIQPLGLDPCGFCGYQDCADLIKHKGICTFNTVDLGIAVGSAASVAAHHHIDNRIMYTVPWVMKNHNLLDENFELCFAIPLSISNKNIFFDR